MRGVYRIYRDGVLVAEQSNLITDVGRNIILRYLAGHVGSFADVLVVGTTQKAPTILDTNVGFEFSRGVVDLRTPDFAQGQVVYKTSLPVEDAGQIYEVGLFPYVSSQVETAPTRILSTFEDSFQTLTGGVSTTDNVRIGSASYRVSPASGATSTVVVESSRNDFSGFNEDDSFTLAYSLNDANTGTIRVRFHVDTANYYQHTITGIPDDAGYYTTDMRIGDFVATGSPSWAAISEMQIDVVAAGGATVVDLDAIRVNDNDTYPDYGLVSRAVFGNPIPKDRGQQLDVEYALEFNI